MNKTMQIRFFLASIMLMVAVCGCNYLRMYPIYSEVKVNHRDHVQIIDENSKFFKEWILTPKKYKLLQEQKMRIDEYIQTHPQLAETHIKALRQLTLMVGMNVDEVRLLIGEPTTIKNKKKEQIVWIYKESSNPVKFYWFYEWAKLYFSSGVLADIETKHLNISDRQPNDYYFGIVGIKDR